MSPRSRSYWRIELRQIIDFFTVNWALKLTALVLAFLLWSVVKAEEPVRITIDNVPIRVDNRDGAWMLAAPPSPQAVSIVVSGPSRELLRVAFERPDVLVPLENVESETEIVLLRSAMVRIYGATDNIRVENVIPNSVDLTFDRVISAIVPLSVSLTGSPVPGFEVGGPVQMEPSVARVNGPSQRVEGLDSLRLPPIDVSGLSATDTFIVGVDTTGLGILVAPGQVRVIVPIEPLGRDTARIQERQSLGEPRSRRGGN